VRRQLERCGDCTPAARCANHQECATQRDAALASEIGAAWGVFVRGQMDVRKPWPPFAGRAAAIALRLVAGLAAEPRRGELARIFHWRAGIRWEALELPRSRDHEQGDRARERAASDRRASARNPSKTGPRRADRPIPHRQQAGRGGMGTVYVGEHTLIGRRAAIKVLQPELSQRREIIGRFFNEARAAAAISHPGIVQIFDFGFADDGSAYIVMELLDGRSLSAVLRDNGPLAEIETVRMIRQSAATFTRTTTRLGDALRFPPADFRHRAA
jgi:hypothetical protein